MAHGYGLAPFIRNLAAVTGYYLANVTAGQLAWDLCDFALTFIPGSVFGAGAHTMARTTARDMAGQPHRPETRKQKGRPSHQTHSSQNRSQISRRRQ